MIYLSKIVLPSIIEIELKFLSKIISFQVGELIGIGIKIRYVHLHTIGTIVPKNIPSRGESTNLILRTW